MHGLSHHLQLDAFGRAMIAQLDIRGRAVVAARIGLVLLVASLSLYAAAGGSGGSSDGSAPLLLGVEGPQSGEQATNGLDQLRGVRLAVSS